MSATDWPLPGERALRRLASRLTSPRRPKLSAALAAVLGDPFAPAMRHAACVALRDGGGPSAAEAWEVLAARGVIPMSWTASSPRSFLARRREPGMRWAPRPAWYQPAELPPSAHAAVTLAADPEGVAAAEALAREFSARVAPWRGSGAPTRVAWRVELRSDVGMSLEPPWFIAGDAVMVALRGAVGSLLRAHWSVESKLRSVLFQTYPSRPGALRAPWIELAIRVLSLENAWWMACSQGLVVPPLEQHSWFTVRPPGWPRALVGRPFATLPVPFAPLAGLLETGYVLEAVEPAFAVLGAPAV